MARKPGHSFNTRLWESVVEPAEGCRKTWCLTARLRVTTIIPNASCRARTVSPERISDYYSGGINITRTVLCWSCSAASKVFWGTEGPFFFIFWPPPFAVPFLSSLLCFLAYHPLAAFNALTLHSNGVTLYQPLLIFALRVAFSVDD